MLLCYMDLVSSLQFSGDLEILSSNQARTCTREFRTKNVTELKYTDKQTPCAKALGIFSDNSNFWGFFQIARKLYRRYTEPQK